MYPNTHQEEPQQPAAEEVYRLQDSSHSLHELLKAGYILSQLSADDLERKKRCDQCCKALNKERRNKPRGRSRLPLAPVLGAPPSDSTPASSPQDSTTAANRKPTNKEAVGGAEPGQHENDTEKPRKTSLVCKFHAGHIINRTWTCCSRPPMSQPCSESDQHVPRQYRKGELEKNWRFYETPNAPLASHVAAVVIDCEMGTASSGESELIRISVVDYFTGAVLLDKLVYPCVRMAHYNTRYSGVTRSAMEDARRRNNCILGRDAARNAVYAFVGPSTVVIGHGANGDLMCLRWIHRVIIDTLLIETRRREIELISSKVSPSAGIQQEASGTAGAAEVEGNESCAFRKEGGMSLKSLALEKLHRVIQIKGRGHDSLEDALATRDLLYWYTTHPLQI